jgi:hypothetical protein
MPNIANPPLATDDISPMTVGDLNPIWNPTIQDKFGNAINLTGLSAGQITLRLKNEASGISKTGLGTVTITNAAAGIITYAWAAGDTNAAGEWLFQWQLNWSGTSPQHSDIGTLLLNAAV